jgi:uncharacterized protein YciI
MNEERIGREPVADCAARTAALEWNAHDLLQEGIGLPTVFRGKGSARVGVERFVRRLFLVYQRHGGHWDWSKGLREQQLWEEHAEFMDGLVEDGVVVLGGPLDEKDVLLVVESESEAAVRARFAPDPWIESGLISITEIRPWTVLLDATRATSA